MSFLIFLIPFVAAVAIIFGAPPRLSALKYK